MNISAVGVSSLAFWKFLMYNILSCVLQPVLSPMSDHFLQMNVHYVFELIMKFI